MKGAEELLAMSKQPVERQVLHHLEQAGAFVRALLFDAAWTSLDRALALAPEDPRVDFARARLLERTGHYREAEERFRALAARGHPGAETAAATLREEGVLLRGEATAPPETWLGLARMHGGEGLLGRALLLLEHAAAAHPDSTEIRQALEALYAFYGGVPGSSVASSS